MGGPGTRREKRERKRKGEERKGWIRAVGLGERDKILQFLGQTPSYCGLADENGRTAAHLVCGYGRLDLAQLFLDQGADFLACDSREVTPMHEIFSISWEESQLSKVEEFLHILLSKQPTVTLNEVTGERDSPLHLSITHSQGRLVPFLLSMGVNVNLQNAKGYSPLLSALELGMIQVAHQLMSAGADMFLRTKNGQDALTFAQRLQNDDVCRLVRERHEERRLIQINNITQEIVDTERSYSQQIQVSLSLSLVRKKCFLFLTPFFPPSLPHLSPPRSSYSSTKPAWPMSCSSLRGRSRHSSLILMRYTHTAWRSWRTLRRCRHLLDQHRH